MGRSALPRCGEPIGALAVPSGPLLVRAVFPAAVERAGVGTFIGAVTVEASENVVGVASPEADVYVAHSGAVVATPLAKDLLAVPVRLSPGATQGFGARGSIRACNGDQDSERSGAGPALPAGTYDVYAVVAVTDDAGQTLIATGGPWTLDIT